MLEAIAPAVGPETAILPLLNGMAHMQALPARFGPGAVLGGGCAVSTVLDAEGRIHQMGAFQSLNFGEMTGPLSPSAKAIREMAGRLGLCGKGQPHDSAGHMGEMDVHRLRRRDDLPDARRDRRYRDGRRQ